MLDTLIDELKSPEFMVMRNAAIRLGKIGDEKAIVPLINAFAYEGDETEDPYEKVSEALVRIGKAAVPHLISNLKNEELNIVYGAAGTLGKMREVSAVPALIDALEDDRGDVRLIAAIALGNIGDHSATPALVELYRCDDETLKYSVADALGKIGDARAVPALTGMLKDKDKGMRRNAAKALGEIGDVSAVPALIEALKDSDLNAHVQENAATSLEKIGKPAVPYLINALKDGNKHVRCYSAEALGNIGDARAIPALIEALKDEESDVRLDVAAALEKVGDASAVPALVEALKDDYWEVRQNATEALASIEKRNPGSVKLEDVQKALKEFVDESNAKREAAEYYTMIAEAVRQGREKIDMPGELLPDKQNPPKRTFRRRSRV